MEAVNEASDVPGTDGLDLWQPLVAQAGGERVFAAQSTPRTCGAAALAMTYRIFARPEQEEAIWPRIHDGYGAAPACHLAADLQDHGLRATIIQSRHPWKMLRSSLQREMLVIVNHRVEPASRAGHYSLLAGMKKDGRRALLFDPIHAAPVWLTQDDLLARWRRLDGGRIAGNVLIAVWNGQDASPAATQAKSCAERETACPLCGTVVPTKWTCPSCAIELEIGPTALLGCVRMGCENRNWRRIYCHRCDQAIGSLGETDRVLLA